MHVSENKPWLKFWPEGVPHHIDYPEIPLSQFLKDSARQYPESTAFGYRGTGLTYRELNEQTGKLARGLSRLGIKKGDCIVLMLHNNLEFVTGYYGILEAGATVVPTNPLYKASELKHHLSDSGANCIITSRESYPTVQEIEGEARPDIVILVDGDGQNGTVSLAEILSEDSAEPLELDISPRDDVAAIVYTGGTTGLPKGVMLTHYNLVANAIQNVAWMQWRKEDIIMGVLPFYHSWGACTSMHSAIYCGAQVVIMPRFNAEELLRTIETEKATVLYSAASLYTMLVSDPLIEKYDISSLRYVKAGAMPVPPEIREKWEKITGVKMVLGYGLSEASPETHNCPPERVCPGTIGIPIIDTDARIMDAKTGEIELPPGEVGELVIKGPQVMKGYLNRPEENKDTLRDGWLHSGDLAFMDEEGYFHITDRKKEIIIYKGHTIAPAEIEATIYEHPAVKECAVIGKLDEMAGEIPKAFIVLKDGCDATGEEIMGFCARKLSPYKKVREVEFIYEIPKTAVGKVLRRVLKEKEESR
ncbi:long-chain fatty acid--CoA ligase [Chloroflexota bacterium]